MLTGNSLLNMLVDELNEMGLPNMAAELDKLYAAPGFLEMDRLTLISELISPEYKDKISKGRLPGVSQSRTGSCFYRRWVPGCRH